MQNISILAQNFHMLGFRRSCEGKTNHEELTCEWISYLPSMRYQAFRAIVGSSAFSSVPLMQPGKQALRLVYLISNPSSILPFPRILAIAKLWMRWMVRNKIFTTWVNILIIRCLLGGPMVLPIRNTLFLHDLRVGKVWWVNLSIVFFLQKTNQMHRNQIYKTLPDMRYAHKRPTAHACRPGGYYWDYLPGSIS